MGFESDAASGLVRIPPPLPQASKPISRETKRALVWGLGLRYQTLLDVAREIVGRPIKSEGELTEAEGRRVVRVVRGRR